MYSDICYLKVFSTDFESTTEDTELQEKHQSVVWVIRISSLRSEGWIRVQKIGDITMTVCHDLITEDYG
jgi:hypothetical protein